MLSDQEKRELQEMAASAQIREEFERIKRLSRVDPSDPAHLDRLLDFLTAMSRCFSSPPRPFVEYTRVLL